MPAPITAAPSVTAFAAPPPSSATPNRPMPDATRTAAAVVPDTAGVTNAFAAATPLLPVANTQVFHSLFTDPGRSTPVAAMVSQFWVTGTGPHAMSDLFKDDGKNG
jgi:hypothetical protein